MQLKIKFSLSGKKQILPLNYQYPIQAWIYRVLNTSDKQFAEMLHENGYRTPKGKQFKLFTFSRLNFPPHTWKVIPKSDRMEVWARNAYLTISFQLPVQIEKFVMGLFQEQKTFIGDKISGIEMQVANIEMLKPKVFDNVDKSEKLTVKLKTVSPIVIGIKEDSDEYEQYVTPVHSAYKGIFLKNLLDKYEATGQNCEALNELDFTVTKLYPKPKLQTIKDFTPDKTQVRAYNYEFELTAPKKILEVGLNSGFGAMSSMGFGFCEVKDEEKKGL